MTTEEDKAVTFVRHIQWHLKEGQVVICKICGKDIHAIYGKEFIACVRCGANIYYSGCRCDKCGAWNCGD